MEDKGKNNRVAFSGILWRAINNKSVCVLSCIDLHEKFYS
jgi:hypothetical protein